MGFGVDGMTAAFAGWWCVANSMGVDSRITKSDPTLSDPRTATVTIVQQGKGAGVSTASAAAFDPTRDGSFTVRWENQSLLCLVAVFGLAG